MRGRGGSARLVQDAEGIQGAADQDPRRGAEADGAGPRRGEPDQDLADQSARDRRPLAISREDAIPGGCGTGQEGEKTVLGVRTSNRPAR
jgi:hypothetical protein